MAKEILPPTDQRFAPLGEAKEIANALMQEYKVKFGDLATARMLFLSKVGGIKLHGERKAATVKTCTGEKKFLSRSQENSMEGWDFIVTFCAEIWAQSDDKLRKRIVFHELKHCLRVEKDDGSTQWRLVPHDLETFYDEVDIFGSSGRELNDLIMQIVASKEKEKD